MKSETIRKFRRGFPPEWRRLLYACFEGTRRRSSRLSGEEIVEFQGDGVRVRRSSPRLVKLRAVPVDQVWQRRVRFADEVGRGSGGRSRRKSDEKGKALKSVLKKVSHETERPELSLGPSRAANVNLGDAKAEIKTRSSGRTGKEQNANVSRREKTKRILKRKGRADSRSKGEENANAEAKSGHDTTQNPRQETASQPSTRAKGKDEPRMKPTQSEKKIDGVSAGKKTSVPKSSKTTKKSQTRLKPQTQLKQSSIAVNVADVNGIPLAVENAEHPKMPKDRKQLPEKKYDALNENEPSSRYPRRSSRRRASYKECDLTQRGISKPFTDKTRSPMNGVISAKPVMQPPKKTTTAAKPPRPPKKSSRKRVQIQSHEGDGSKKSVKPPQPSRRSSRRSVQISEPKEEKPPKEPRATQTRKSSTPRRARPKRQVAFASAPEPEGAKKPVKWSSEQKAAFEKQRNAIPATDPDYWESIAIGIADKSADECKALWEANWRSPHPQTKKRKRVRAAATPDVVRHVMKGAKRKKSRETAKFRGGVRKLRDVVARDMDDEMFEPQIETPKGVDVSFAAITGELENGTPGTEIRRKREIAEGGSKRTPQVRQGAIGLQDADEYVSLFRRRQGVASTKAQIAPQGKSKSQTGSSKEGAGIVRRLHSIESSDAEDEDGSEGSDDDGDLFF